MLLIHIICDKPLGFSRCSHLCPSFLLSLPHPLSLPLLLRRRTRHLKKALDNPRNLRSIVGQRDAVSHGKQAQHMGRRHLLPRLHHRHPPCIDIDTLTDLPTLRTKFNCDVPEFNRLGALKASNLCSASFASTPPLPTPSSTPSTALSSVPMASPASTPPMRASSSFSPAPIEVLDGATFIVACLGRRNSSPELQRFNRMYTYVELGAINLSKSMIYAKKLEEKTKKMEKWRWRRQLCMLMSILC